MAVTITLRQEKKVLVNSFLAVSTIIGASPAGYFPVFVVSQNGGVDTDERFDRVATINDTATLVENTLTRLQSKVGALWPTAVPTDTITILNAPTSWFDTFFIQAKFTVVAVSGGFDRLDILGTKPFPTALDNVNWELRDSFGTFKTSGTGTAKAIRSNLAITQFLRRHLNQTFSDVQRATNHVNSIHTFIHSLVNSLNVDVDAFTGIETNVFPT